MQATPLDTVTYRRTSPSAIRSTCRINAGRVRPVFFAARSTARARRVSVRKLRLVVRCGIRRPSWADRNDGGEFYE